jgi:hypothetical protein
VIPQSRLRLVRAAWFGLATIALAALLASIPAYIRLVGVFTEEERFEAGLLGAPGLFSPSPQFEFWMDSAYNLLSFGAATLSLALAALIFWRRPREPIAFIVSLTLLAYGVVMAGPLEMLLGQVLAGQSVAFFGQMLLWGFVIFLFFIFPDGRFVPGWTRWFSLLLVPWTLALALLQLYTSVATNWVPFFFLFTLPSLAAPFAQLVRYRRVSDAVQRQQTKWVILGFTAWILAGTAVAGLLIAVTRLLVVPSTPTSTPASLMFVVAGRLLWPASLTFVPLALTVAILRYRLWDIDVIIRRTLVYAVLTGLLALVYFGAVLGLQSLFGILTGQRQSTLVTVFSTLLIAALFGPLRRSVQSLIDRRFYRNRYDAAKILAAFGATLRDETNLDELRARLLDVVEESMRPASVALWLRAPTDSASRTQLT